VGAGVDEKIPPEDPTGDLITIFSSTSVLDCIRTSSLQLSFITGDFLVGSHSADSAAWYCEADCVYVASLLFSEDMMERLCSLAHCMKPGAVLISLRPIVSADPNRIELITDSFYQMSWQKSRVYVYRHRILLKQR
jgi:hypothetical protein